MCVHEVASLHDYFKTSKAKFFLLLHRGPLEASTSCFKKHEFQLLIQSTTLTSQNYFFLRFSFQITVSFNGFEKKKCFELDFIKLFSDTGTLKENCNRRKSSRKDDRISSQKGQKSFTLISRAIGTEARSENSEAKK